MISLRMVKFFLLISYGRIQDCQKNRKASVSSSLSLPQLSSSRERMSFVCDQNFSSYLYFFLYSSMLDSILIIKIIQVKHQKLLIFILQWVYLSRQTHLPNRNINFVKQMYYLSFLLMKQGVLKIPRQGLEQRSKKHKINQFACSSILIPREFLVNYCEGFYVFS